MKRSIKKIQEKAKNSKPKNRSIFNELWEEERKNLYLKEQQVDKAERKASAALIRKRTRVNDSLNKVLLLRYIFDSMPGKTFEEKKKAYNKFKESSALLKFNEKTREFKGSWFGLPHFIGIRGNKANKSLKRVEKMAGIAPLDMGELNELKNIEKQEDIEKLNNETRNILAKLEALDIVRIKRWRNKVTGVQVINPKAYEQMLETKRIPWPELPALKKKKG